VLIQVTITQIVLELTMTMEITNCGTFQDSYQAINLL